MQEGLDDKPLDSIMRNGIFRGEVRKSLFAYLRDQIGWWRRGEHFRAEWVRFGNLPPDWYRPETDAEFRVRIKKAQEEQ